MTEREKQQPSRSSAGDGTGAPSGAVRELDGIRARIEHAIQTQHIGAFAWPDDGCCAEPWAYWVHCAWVDAWNASRREQEVNSFLRAWMAVDANLLDALERKRRWEQEESSFLSAPSDPNPVSASTQPASSDATAGGRLLKTDSESAVAHAAARKGER